MSEMGVRGVSFSSQQSVRAASENLSNLDFFFFYSYRNPLTPFFIQYLRCLPASFELQTEKHVHFDLSSLFALCCCGINLLIKQL